MFSINPQQDDWRFYNWDKVTTVVMAGYIDMDLVCLAHKYGARAITIGKLYYGVIKPCCNNIFIKKAGK